MTRRMPCSRKKATTVRKSLVKTRCADDRLNGRQINIADSDIHKGSFFNENAHISNLVVKAAPKNSHPVDQV